LRITWSRRRRSASCRFRGCPWTRGAGALAALALTAAAAEAQAAAAAPPAGPGPAAPPRVLSQQELDGLAHKHAGYFGALAPQNLRKPRPKAPFDTTGAWFIDLHEGFDKFMFGPPYPEFAEPGQTALKEAAVAASRGERYRDSIGQCFPAGMPMIMTRVWPIGMIQLPTAIYMVFGFTNSLRIIYLDGRKHTDPDEVVPSYNGESIGHWEGDTLVVSTKYLEPNQHWIDRGIPVSDQFEITERIRMRDQGMTLEIEYVMTDPKMWKGEWRNTKRWTRQDYSDIPEVECLPNLNEKLPSTAEGHAAVEAREAAKEPATK
jgi:hypothetical protein